MKQNPNPKPQTPNPKPLKKRQVINKMENSSEIKLVLKTVKGGMTDLMVSPDCQVTDLKQKIFELKNIDVSSQKLICRGKHLTDDKNLSDYKIKENDCIILMILKQVKIIRKKQNNLLQSKKKKNQQIQIQQIKLQKPIIIIIILLLQ